MRRTKNTWKFVLVLYCVALMALLPDGVCPCMVDLTTRYNGIYRMRYAMIAYNSAVIPTHRHRKSLPGCVITDLPSTTLGTFIHNEKQSSNLE